MSIFERMLPEKSYVFLFIMRRIHVTRSRIVTLRRSARLGATHRSPTSSDCSVYLHLRSKSERNNADVSERKTATNFEFVPDKTHSFAFDLFAQITFHFRKMRVKLH